MPCTFYFPSAKPKERGIVSERRRIKMRLLLLFFIINLSSCSNLRGGLLGVSHLKASPLLKKGEKVSIVEKKYLKENCKFISSITGYIPKAVGVLLNRDFSDAEKAMTNNLRNKAGSLGGDVLTNIKKGKISAWDGTTRVTGDVYFCGN